MATCCQICDSTAVVSKETTTTLVVLIGTLESFLLGVTEVQVSSQESEQQSHLAQVLARISKGVLCATSGYRAALAFAQDVQKYQFSHYDYLCLRCGAKFDQSACTEASSPTIISASDAQPSARPAPQPSADPQDPTVSTTD